MTRYNLSKLGKSLKIEESYQRNRGVNSSSWRGKTVKIKGTAVNRSSLIKKINKELGTNDLQLKKGRFFGLIGGSSNSAIRNALAKSLNIDAEMITKNKVTKKSLQKQHEKGQEQGALADLATCNLEELANLTKEINQLMAEGESPASWIPEAWDALNTSIETAINNCESLEDTGNVKEYLNAVLTDSNKDTLKNTFTNLLKGGLSRCSNLEEALQIYQVTLGQADDSHKDQIKDTITELIPNAMDAAATLGERLKIKNQCASLVDEDCIKQMDVQIKEEIPHALQGAKTVKEVLGIEQNLSTGKVEFDRGLVSSAIEKVAPAEIEKCSTLNDILALRTDVVDRVSEATVTLINDKVAEKAQEGIDEDTPLADLLEIRSEARGALPPEAIKTIGEQIEAKIPKNKSGQVLSQWPLEELQTAYKAAMQKPEKAEAFVILQRLLVEAMADEESGPQAIKDALDQLDRPQLRAFIGTAITGNADVDKEVAHFLGKYILFECSRSNSLPTDRDADFHLLRDAIVALCPGKDQAILETFQTALIEETINHFATGESPAIEANILSLMDGRALDHIDEVDSIKKMGTIEDPRDETFAEPGAYKPCPSRERTFEGQTPIITDLKSAEQTSLTGKTQVGATQVAVNVLQRSMDRVKNKNLPEHTWKTKDLGTEDRAVVGNHLFKIKGEDVNTTLALSCDGNRGSTVSHIYAKEAPAIFSRYLQEYDSISDEMVACAMRQTAKALESIVAIQKDISDPSASTLNMTFLFPQNGKMRGAVLNRGDGAAMLLGDSDTQPTYLHPISDPNSGVKQGISDADKDPVKRKDPFQVNLFELNEGNKILIASDGLWHTASASMVNNHFNNAVNEENGTLATIQSLCDLSIRGRDDDRNIIVLELGAKIPEAIE